jgi:alkylation response protein AidB-like acyl-CoA dehydrogenase
MRTRAVRDGDEWVLNGSKIYITSAEYAGCFVVWAVTDAEAPKGKGISCFIVDNGLPGIDISKPEDKMGQRGSATNVVNFTDCRIPASALMGKEGQGFKVAVGELAGGRIGVGSLALGIGLAALDYARDYTGEREQFDAKIGSFQGLQWMLADRYTELEAARLLLMQAAWNKEQANCLPAKKPTRPVTAPCRSWAAPAIFGSTPWRGWRETCASPASTRAPVKSSG